MLLLVGVGLLLACSETNRNYVYKEATCFGYEDFLERKELKGSVWEADSSLLLPTKLQMYDTLLAVLTPQEDKILHLVDVNSGKRVNMSRANSGCQLYANEYPLSAWST